jgi:hypothetical protein
MSEPVKFKSIDEAIEAYVNTRDELRVKQQAFKLEEDAMKANMEQISMWLREKADELGVDSFKTQFGTAYRSVKTSYRVATGGWDNFISWVKETGNFQCLEKRVAKLATKEIHDDTGEIPPGLDYVAEVEFDVRRPTKAKA